MLALKIFLYILGLAMASFDEDCLQRHNYYRAQHTDTPPLELNQDIQSYAQEWANHLANKTSVDHRPPPRRYGENIFWSPKKHDKAFAAVDRWYCEINHFNWSNVGFTEKTGHFTQVVWKRSTKLGCAAAIGKNGLFVVANYLKHGNVYKWFDPNVGSLKGSIDPLCKKSNVHTTTKHSEKQTTALNGPGNQVETTTTKEMIIEKDSTDKCRTITDIFESIVHRMPLTFKRRSDYESRVAGWQNILSRNELLPNTDEDLKMIESEFVKELATEGPLQNMLGKFFSIRPHLSEFMENLLRFVAGLPIAPTFRNLNKEFSQMKNTCKDGANVSDIIGPIIEKALKQATKKKNSTTTTSNYTTEIKNNENQSILTIFELAIIETEDTKRSSHDARIDAWKKLLSHSDLPAETDEDLRIIANHFESKISSKGKLAESLKKIFGAGADLAETMEIIYCVVAGLPLPPTIRDPELIQLSHNYQWLLIPHNDKSHKIEKLIFDAIFHIMSTKSSSSTKTYNFSSPKPEEEPIVQQEFFIKIFDWVISITKNIIRSNSAKRIEIWKKLLTRKTLPTNIDADLVNIQEQFNKKFINRKLKDMMKRIFKVGADLAETMEAAFDLVAGLPLPLSIKDPEILQLHKNRQWLFDTDHARNEKIEEIIDSAICRILLERTAATITPKVSAPKALTKGYPPDENGMIVKIFDWVVETNKNIVRSSPEERIKIWKKLLTRNNLPSNTDKDLVAIGNQFKNELTKGKLHDLIERIFDVGEDLAETMEAAFDLVAGLSFPLTVQDPEILELNKNRDWLKYDDYARNEKIESIIYSAIFRLKLQKTRTIDKTYNAPIPTVFEEDITGNNELIVLIFDLALGKTNGMNRTRTDERLNCWKKLLTRSDLPSGADEDLVEIRNQFQKKFSDKKLQELLEWIFQSGSDLAETMESVLREEAKFVASLPSTFRLDQIRKWLLLTASERNLKIFHTIKSRISEIMSKRTQKVITSTKKYGLQDNNFYENQDIRSLCDNIKYPKIQSSVFAASHATHIYNVFQHGMNENERLKNSLHGLFAGGTISRETLQIACRRFGELQAVLPLAKGAFYSGYSNTFVRSLYGTEQMAPIQEDIYDSLAKAKNTYIGRILGTRKPFAGTTIRLFNIY